MKFAIVNSRFQQAGQPGVTTYGVCSALDVSFGTVSEAEKAVTLPCSNCHENSLLYLCGNPGPGDLR